ncbi:hypothetical protein D3C86_1812810 [compost metagenome]
MIVSAVLIQVYGYRISYVTTIFVDAIVQVYSMSFYNGLLKQVLWIRIIRRGIQCFHRYISGQ